ncbi:hypothetical protein [Streptomyces brasiliensis]|uniref:Lipoprotein n=1 Tax=Streptomyces brasiliensis TaxID=1954 RepID=A0A917KV30_9ACTN|nr:hypothetical protein [Streptomyces brasiliensis]GGJ31309.1 hypothetical protein GCM10010121_048260 [Streptomyces brasiliensis]
MRIRATVAAVSGALALSAFVVPAAHAGNGTAFDHDDLVKAAQAAHHGAGKSAFSTSAAADTGVPYALDLSFSNVKINNGKSINGGTTTHTTVPVTYTVTHAEGIDVNAPDFMMDVEIYRGTYDNPVNVLFGDAWPTCTVVSATQDSCKGTIDVYADIELTNSDATKWKAIGYAIDWNDQDPNSDNIDWNKVGYVDQDGVATASLKRLTKATADGSPEPVVKGRTITIKGKLTLANWNDHKYHGYAGQSVQLQFRKKGSTTYSSVKGIKSDSAGNLRTTVTASVDGHYRFYFPGASYSAQVTATGDYVGVK